MKGISLLKVILDTQNYTDYKCAMTHKSQLTPDVSLPYEREVVR